MIKFNKKAQIGQTLTWFIAFVIISFILFLFVSISMLSAGKKTLFNPNEISLSMDSSLGAVNLLDAPVLFEGKNMPFKDAYLYTIEPLLNEEFLEKSGGLEESSKLSKSDLQEVILKSYVGQASWEIYGKQIENHLILDRFTEKQSLLLESLNHESDLGCLSHYLDMPFFKVVINKNGATKWTTLPEEVTQKYKGTSFNFNLYENGQSILIKSYSIEKC